MDVKKEKYLEVLWLFAVFAFFYVWFSRIHPLVVYDADDWTYLAYVRKATPIWGEWNPAKVFPEVLFPFFSTIILHTVVPLAEDYITGFTIGHALIVSGFLTAYTWCMVSMLRRSFSLSRITGILVGILFLIFHFLVFRTEDFGNSYLFLCEDLNCYYNYLLPALLNSCLLLKMMNRDGLKTFLTKAHPAYIGVFYVVIYFAVFSNLVTSGILAAYAGSQLLLELLKVCKRFRLKDYVKENAIWLVILVMWFVSAVFELSGGRASTSAPSVSLQSIHMVAYRLKEVLLSCSPVFWICVFTITILAVMQFLLAKHRGEDETRVLQQLITVSVAGLALLVYMILLCAMIWSGNIYRSEYQFPLFFYGFLLVFLGLGYLLKKQPRIMLVLPLVLVFLASDINTSGKTFQDSLVSEYDPSICAQISRDIISQYLEADAAGLESTTLYVPMHVYDPVNEDNWPHSAFLLNRIGTTLYEQGIISRPIHVTVEADPEVNERYNLPVPTAPAE